jgi:hypothetical protein
MNFTFLDTTREDYCVYVGRAQQVILPTSGLAYLRLVWTFASVCFLINCTGVPPVSPVCSRIYPPNCRNTKSNTTCLLGFYLDMFYPPVKFVGCTLCTCTLYVYPHAHSCALTLKTLNINLYCSIGQSRIFIFKRSALKSVTWNIVMKWSFVVTLNKVS